MVLCQPPITEIWAKPMCCSRNSYGSDPEHPRAPRPTPVRSPSGVTVKDLLNVVKELNRTHRHCPYATPCQHNRNGDVHVDVTFTGTMFSRPDDPAIQAHRPSAWSHASFPSDNIGHGRASSLVQIELGEYIAAKRDGNSSVSNTSH